MGNNMRKWESYFNSTEEAISYTRDKAGKFAFLNDIPFLEYYKGQYCDLKLVDNGYGNIGYGFGLPKKSVYTKELTIMIYQLRESGYLDTLDNKWIAKTSICEEKADNRVTEETVEVGMPSLWGVFWIIYGGLGVSCLILIWEWFSHAKSEVDPNNKKKPQTFGEAVKLQGSLLLDDLRNNWLPFTCPRRRCCNSVDDSDKSAK